jgi:uncharacterized protein (DUF1697 family)
MTRYAGFLRAVNVGGTTKLPMAELRELCREIGFEEVQTYIASGNVVFSYAGGASKAEQELEAALSRRYGKSIAVFVRDRDEMDRIVADNPFSDKEPRLTMAFLLKSPPPKETLSSLTGRKGELVVLGNREIYVHYPDGSGRSKLKIPAAMPGTSRNMNTLAALAKMLAD